MTAQNWSFDGEIVDTCNCDVVCPCTMGQPASFGACLGTITWFIDKGHYGDVDLSGCIAQISVHAPGPYFDDGDWRIAFYGHDEATEDQRKAIETVFLGHAGGFFGEWREMTREVVGVRWVPIEFEREGNKRVIRIDGVLDMDAEAIAGSDGDGVAQLVNPPFWKGAPFTATLGRSKRYRFKDFDLGWEGDGKASSYSECHYEGP